MNLRDEFAGQALAGLLAGSTGSATLAERAAYAYKLADAMLAARVAAREPAPSDDVWELLERIDRHLGSSYWEGPSSRALHPFWAKAWTQIRETLARRDQ